jgi:hypothetical protein
VLDQPSAVSDATAVEHFVVIFRLGQHIEDDVRSAQIRFGHLASDFDSSCQAGFLNPAGSDAIPDWIVLEPYGMADVELFHRENQEACIAAAEVVEDVARTGTRER